jgi:hypothetical protein
MTSEVIEIKKCSRLVTNLEVALSELAIQQTGEMGDLY